MALLVWALMDNHHSGRPKDGMAADRESILRLSIVFDIPTDGLLIGLDTHQAEYSVDIHDVRVGV